MNFGFPFIVKPFANGGGALTFLDFPESQSTLEPNCDVQAEAAMALRRVIDWRLRFGREVPRARVVDPALADVTNWAIYSDEDPTRSLLRFEGKIDQELIAWLVAKAIPGLDFQADELVRNRVKSAIIELCQNLMVDVSGPKLNGPDLWAKLEIILDNGLLCVDVTLLRVPEHLIETKASQIEISLKPVLSAQPKGADIVVLRREVSHELGIHMELPIAA